MPNPVTYRGVSVAQLSDRDLDRLVDDGGLWRRAVNDRRSATAWMKRLTDALEDEYIRRHPPIGAPTDDPTITADVRAWLEGLGFDLSGPVIRRRAVRRVRRPR